MIKFVWTDDFEEIPEYLVDQIKGKEFSSDEFYAFNGAVKTSLRWLLLVKEERVVGFCWGAIQVLTENILINNISLDKKYQNKGLMEQCLMKIEKMGRSIGIKKIAFVGNRSNRVFKKLNFQDKGVYFRKEIK